MSEMTHGVADVHIHGILKLFGTHDHLWVCSHGYGEATA